MNDKTATERFIPYIKKQIESAKTSFTAPYWKEVLCGLHPSLTVSLAERLIVHFDSFVQTLSMEELLALAVLKVKLHASTTTLTRFAFEHINKDTKKFDSPKNEAKYAIKHNEGTLDLLKIVSQTIAFMKSSGNPFG